MIRVIWSDGALRDLARHVRYIADFNPRAAAMFAHELRAAAKNLRAFPHRGRPGQQANTRELVTVWPYVMVYNIAGQAHQISSQRTPTGKRFKKTLSYRRYE